jgi:glycosyltransferase involved in cell wall biosynthesis
VKKVTIIQRILPHYRKEFFFRLKEKLYREGVQLQIIYGTPGKDSSKKDQEEASWATKINNKYFQLGPLEIVWQPALELLKDQELIIVEQANKNLINYLLLAKRIWDKSKVAFWGHGLNRQDNPKSLTNRFKHKLLKSPDWWFAYTGGVRDFLKENRYPPNKITNVQNAIDTRILKEAYQQFDESEIPELERQLNLVPRKTAIYCGGIYAEKRIEFLIQVAQQLKSAIPEFSLLIIGSGPDRTKLEGLIQGFDYIHYFGPITGKERIKYFKVSSIMLMPGLVGLAILDAFALETPMITTKYPYHSPEIEYLEHNVNGLITADNQIDYFNTVKDLLQNPDKIQQLAEGCRNSAEKYTLDQMVDNFAEGIKQALYQDKN